MNSTLTDDQKELRRQQHRRETELKTKYWNKMIWRGSGVHQHDGTRQSAELVIMSLMHKPNFGPTEDFKEMMQTLYIEEPAVPDNEPQPTSVKTRGKPSSITKLLWTCFRCCSVLLGLIISSMAYDEVQRHGLRALQWDAFTRLVCVVGAAGVAGLGGLWYGSTWVSEGSLFTLYILNIIFMLEDETLENWMSRTIGLKAALLLPTLSMTWLYWYQYPHTVDMYWL
jgi:hypothetical protein